MSTVLECFRYYYHLEDFVAFKLCENWRWIGSICWQWKKWIWSILVVLKLCFFIIYIFCYHFSFLFYTHEYVYTIILRIYILHFFKNILYPHVLFLLTVFNVKEKCWFIVTFKLNLVTIWPEAMLFVYDIGSMSEKLYLQFFIIVQTSYRICVPYCLLTLYHCFGKLWHFFVIPLQIIISHIVFILSYSWHYKFMKCTMLSFYISLPFSKCAHIKCQFTYKYFVFNSNNENFWHKKVISTQTWPKSEWWMCSLSSQVIVIMELFTNF